jgi:hypothetical protein
VPPNNKIWLKLFCGNYDLLKQAKESPCAAQQQNIVKIVFVATLNSSLSSSKLKRALVPPNNKICLKLFCGNYDLLNQAKESSCAAQQQNMLKIVLVATLISSSKLKRALVPLNNKIWLKLFVATLICLSKLNRAPVPPNNKMWLTLFCGSYDL